MLPSLSVCVRPAGGLPDRKSDPQGRPPRSLLGASLVEGRSRGARGGLHKGLLWARAADGSSCSVRSSVFALHFTEPPISAQLLAFLRVFCMTEGKSLPAERAPCPKTHPHVRLWGSG